MMDKTGKCFRRWLEKSPSDIRGLPTKISIWEKFEG
jgi:hypothetical protein